MTKLPIGISDFKDLRQKQRYYVDKTLLAEELMDDSASVILLPRPRRFGKTLNLSMLRYFFNCAEDNAHLFNGLAITHSPAWAQHHGQYPVLYLTLKDCKALSWQQVQYKLAKAIGNMCAPYRHLLTEGVLHPHEQGQLEALLNLTANLSQLESSMQMLGEVLHRHYNKQVVMLIDEYDSPLIEAYQYNYYDPMRNTLRNLLSAALKDNAHLAKGVVTGILRVAKESLFSGLNNLKTATVLKKAYHNKFGFTNAEVQAMLNHFNLSTHYQPVEQWYNGYNFGGTAIYNPWSIVSFIDEAEEGPQPFWVNTSSNELIAQQFNRASAGALQKLDQLVQGISVESPVSEHTVFSDLERGNESTLFSFLLFSGYLKAELARTDNSQTWYRLSIPNVEVARVYNTLFRSYLNDPLGVDTSHNLLQELLHGAANAFATQLQHYVIEAFSYFDFAGQQPERVYHGFMLGLVAYLHDTHQISSNRETGLGRADMLIVPRDDNDAQGYVLEFKRAASPEAVEATATEALQQIKNKQYTTQLRQQGKTRMHQYAIAFYGKTLAVAYQCIG